jgi:hypothetical protein
MFVEVSEGEIINTDAITMIVIKTHGDETGAYVLLLGGEKLDLTSDELDILLGTMKSKVVRLS